jgi:mycobactin phenyloxazoline synthetase
MEDASPLWVNWPFWQEEVPDPGPACRELCPHELPAPDGVRTTGQKELVALSTPEEKVLAGIWAQALGVERVSVEEPFFEIGGDSLLAVQLISRVRDALRVELSLRELFDAMTVAEMARQVVAREARPGLTGKLARILVAVQEMDTMDADDEPEAGA